MRYTMKTIITLVAVINIGAVSLYAQDKCIICDSLKSKSRLEYNYDAYKQYEAECIIRDTIFYDQSVVVQVKEKSDSYTVQSKSYCGNYFSYARYKTKDGEILNGYFVESRDTVYLKIDEEHGLQITMGEIIHHISKQTNYPKKCRKEKIEGIIYVSFILNEQGNPINTFVVKGADPLLNEEAVRVINSLKNISPAKHNGKSVKILLNQQIKFKLG